MDEVKACVEAKKVNPYNILVAVVIARNRITTFANGVSVVIRAMSQREAWCPFEQDWANLAHLHQCTWNRSPVHRSPPQPVL